MSVGYTITSPRRKAATASSIWRSFIESGYTIGRGLLNIEGLPVFRDSVGGIGTPTSDNERTKLSEDTPPRRKAATASSIWRSFIESGYISKIFMVPNSLCVY